jgi:hypothetical protein
MGGCLRMHLKLRNAEHCIHGERQDVFLKIYNNEKNGKFDGL